MNKDSILRSLQSFVVLPILATNMLVLPAGTIMLPTARVSMTEQNGPLIETITDNQQKIRIDTAKNIDTYFANHDMPLEGTGMKMVIEAEKNNIDPYLIAAIAVRESTGGKHQCKSQASLGKVNPFGWGGCKLGFTSYDAAIETVARNLGGNNPKTAHHYGDKSTIEKLEAYNPRTVVARYPEQVMDIMNDMASLEFTSAEKSA
ncbi:MAG: glucosaminidase domain-containing protein [Candidatus Pacebacteria bacterium]|nr:glucosaminidase domain-containing protein [Candidatus Paceibacterota bacterium]MBP9772868.1 glucosaminidase domain-containing protein [Candidatus Paceibacterota bacterium]